MAIELARRNIRVNSISPGLVFTGMTGHAFRLLSEDHVEQIKASHPLGPGQPEDIARLTTFLLDDHSGWITGQVIGVDGGLSAIRAL